MIKDRKTPLKGSRPSVPHGTNFFLTTYCFFQTKCRQIFDGERIPPSCSRKSNCWTMWIEAGRRSYKNCELFISQVSCLLSFYIIQLIAVASCCDSSVVSVTASDYNWRAPWKNRTSRYISFFRSSLSGVLFPMFCLLVEGECLILML